MQYVKTWRVLGDLTESEIHWLCNSKFEVDIERSTLDLHTFGNRFPQGIPTLPKVTVKTQTPQYETLLELQFAGRLVLESEVYYDELHGCNINF